MKKGIPFKGRDAVAAQRRRRVLLLTVLLVAVAAGALMTAGAPADAERALAPLRKLGTPLKDGIAPVDYVALQRS